METLIALKTLAEIFSPFGWALGIGEDHVFVEDVSESDVRTVLSENKHRKELKNFRFGVSTETHGRLGCKVTIKEN